MLIVSSKGEDPFTVLVLGNTVNAFSQDVQKVNTMVNLYFKKSRVWVL